MTWLDMLETFWQEDFEDFGDFELDGLVAKFVDLVGLVAKFVDLGGQALWQDVLA